METKISKVRSLDKAGPPYARFKGAGETAQAYNMEMEDGTKALFDGEADVQPTVVGALHAYHIVKSKAGTEWIKFDAVPAAQAPEPKKVATVLDVPKVPDTTVPPSMRSVPAQPAAPVAKAEPVAEKPKAPAIPDSVPRKGVVESVSLVETVTPRDTPEKRLYKYWVVMTDNSRGVMWVQAEHKEDPHDPPTMPGATVTYVYGKTYNDGTKRMDAVVEGSTMSKEGSIVRISCLNTAAALMALPRMDGAQYENLPEAAIEIAMELEKYVLGTNDN